MHRAAWVDREGFKDGVVRVEGCPADGSKGVHSRPSLTDQRSTNWEGLVRATAARCLVRVCTRTYS